ncbi:ionotropic receptor 75a-like [Aricia agestis]|uniref:ionotropic receptor 75a-like n=1 Tax=Aricia agestis TaxID=91739 RepID=UPI001C205D22|nr:ionotropic receptor 75a-like [Aricia agestis]
MVGELQRGRGDVGGSGVFFRADRAQFIQYVVEVWKVRPCFIFRHPKYPGGFYSVFTRPLSTTVWGCLVLLLVVAAALMVAMLWASAFDDTSLSLMFVFVSGAVGQQGIPIYSQSSAIKILIFSTLIFTLTIYQYYNATVVSTLLREPPTTIRTLEDLLHSKMDIGIEDTLYDRDYFRRTTDPIAIQLYRTKIDTPKHRNIFPAEIGMQLVRAGGFAFHLESVAGYRLMRGGFEEREICEAQEVALYPPQHVGVVVKKGSPYREFFAVGIRKMYESGIMVRLNSAWEESKPACVRTPDTGAISVTIADFSMALVVVGLGMVVAGIALVGEMVVFRLSRR